MRILICYPWLKLGGAPNTSITLAKGLKERGHDVYFFTGSGGMYEQRLRDAGIPFITAPYNRFLPGLYHLNCRAYRLMCSALDDLSIELVHAVHPNPYHLALFAAPQRNIPVVLTLLWLGRHFRLPAYPGRLIFVAEEFLDDWKPQFVGRYREAVVIANRIDVDMFRGSRDYAGFAHRHGLPESGWKIAFMSRIDPMKFGSLRCALEAVRLLGGRTETVSLAIAGGGALLGELADRAGSVNRDLGYEAVKLLGTIFETPELLAWSDVVIGIGRCIWEGMACGKPAIVVGENGYAGVVEPGTAGDLAYYNFAGRNVGVPVPPQALAEAIEKIMTDDERYRFLAEYAQSYVTENLDYRVGVEKIEKLYERALADPPLTASQRFGLFATNVANGPVYQSYRELRRFLRMLAGRGRPNDTSHGHHTG